MTPHPSAATVRRAAPQDQPLWDAYVRKHRHASSFHLFGWGQAINKTYGHALHYLMLVESAPRTLRVAPSGTDNLPERLLGVLPLVHLRHPIVGSRLVSLPFLDGGGILADSVDAEGHLLTEAVRLAQQNAVGLIELRHERLMEGVEKPMHPVVGASASCLPPRVLTRSNKVRMLLKLPESSDLLMKSFKSKLRSQINKPLRAGLVSRIGGPELLEDFYKVFLVNMRDLGSPVHSLKLMKETLNAFPNDARIVVVYRQADPVSAALVVGFGGTLRNPWSFSLRRYASLSPNMLLYLRILEFACDRGYEFFDFGRSTQGEGTYKFKEQWGAIPEPLYWQYISLDGKTLSPGPVGKGRLEWATSLWRMLPVPVTKVLGPRIRKHISL